MNNITYVIVILLSLNLLLLESSLAQEQKIILVKDEQGNPISGAKVIFEEDSRETVTDENGEFLINDESNTYVHIEAESYEAKLMHVSLIDESVELIRMPFQLREEDDVFVPFGTLKQRRIPGAVTTIMAEEILRYDQQNSVGGLLRGRVPGLFGSSGIRGLSSPLFVVNGVPTVDLYVHPLEIDQVTVLKDFSAGMLYGSQANNGVILITTKRGSKRRNEIKLTAEYGINNPIAYPDYLSSAEYMELYNEAAENDGLDPRYSDEAIEMTRTGANPVRFPDERYYNSTYLNNMSNYHNFNAQLFRGDEDGQFFLSLGWNRNTGLLKIGEGANERDDRFNLRSALDYQLADKIGLVFNGSVNINQSNAPAYRGDDFWGISTTYRPNIFPILIPTSFLMNEYPQLVETANTIDNKYILGGTGDYLTNVYGELLLNGERKSIESLMDFNMALDFDLNGLTKGLTARGILSFIDYNLHQEEKQNSYAVYSPIFSGDTLTSISKLGNDVKVHDQTVTGGDYYKRLGFHGILNYERAFGNHEIKVDALTFMDLYSQQGLFQPTKYGHIGFRANYMNSNKYVAQLTGVYAGSGKYIETENKFAFSPGIGLGWIVTEEDFLQGNSVIDYLKIRSNWSLLKTDENVSDYNLGHNYYTNGPRYNYSDGGFYNVSKVLYPGNPELGWEKISNFNLGFETVLFDYSLGFEASYFYYKNYDIISRREYTLPKYFGITPYDNYGSTRTEGVEVGVNYSMSIGPIAVDIGGNMAYSLPKLLSADETYYVDEGRKTVGKPTDAIFGYVALGLFKNQDEIDAHAQQTFDKVQPGDIKYEDINHDKVIDQNDQKMIGNSRARINYGFNIKVKFKSFELFALAVGQAGSNSQFNNPYYWVYGDRKYSEVVRGRWTPGTADVATYPRLSATSNSNNFRNSTFWLYKNNWFTIQTVQLNYTLSALNFAGLDDMRLFLRGDNLAKFSKIKEKTNLNIGSVPQMRSVSFGINLMF